MAPQKEGTQLKNIQRHKAPLQRIDGGDVKATVEGEKKTEQGKL